MPVTEHSRLRLLSGTLEGVEFSLEAGDNIFLVGHARDIATSGETLGRAENVFYIPDSRHDATLRIRCDENGTPVALHVREHQQWTTVPLLLNSVLHAAGLDFAVRAGGEAWADAVLDHSLPGNLARVDEPRQALEVAPQRRAQAWPLAVLLMGVLLAIGGWWAYERGGPAVQVRSLQALLATSPFRYSIIAGPEGRVYVFADEADAVAWGQRASRRAGRQDDVYLERREEAARLGQALEEDGLAHAVVRLNEPQRPEAVIMRLGVSDDRRIARAAELVKQHATYARDVGVLTVTDEELVSKARTELRARGISTRLEPGAGRASIVNDAFLDDSRLHAMLRYRDAFTQQWGDRRIGIRALLWDDLLKGRSYQYSQDQLLSVGQGRWEFSNAVQN